jgi:hypothetical protein
MVVVTVTFPSLESVGGVGTMTLGKRKQGPEYLNGK